MRRDSLISSYKSDLPYLILIKSQKSSIFNKNTYHTWSHTKIPQVYPLSSCVLLMKARLCLQAKTESQIPMNPCTEPNQTNLAICCFDPNLRSECLPHIELIYCLREKTCSKEMLLLQTLGAENENSFHPFFPCSQYNS